MLGLAGEVGSLLSFFKKKLRDGADDLEFKNRTAEELGDILWYLATTASYLGHNLNEVARRNLEKTTSRYELLRADFRQPGLFQNLNLDNSSIPSERFKRQFVVEFKELAAQDSTSFPKTEMTVDGEKFGHQLNDNAYEDDGYRYHDVYHFAYVAILHWSPVVRKLMGLKRKKMSPEIDRIEDGARAIVIEEAITSVIYVNAERNNFFQSTNHVDAGLLGVVRDSIQGLEVARLPEALWIRVIIEASKVYHELHHYRGGKVFCNMEERTIRFERS